MHPLSLPYLPPTPAFWTGTTAELPLASLGLQLPPQNFSVAVFGATYSSTQSIELNPQWLLGVYMRTSLHAAELWIDKDNLYAGHGIVDSLA